MLLDGVWWVSGSDWFAKATMYPWHASFEEHWLMISFHTNHRRINLWTKKISMKFSHQRGSKTKLDVRSLRASSPKWLPHLLLRWLIFGTTPIPKLQSPLHLFHHFSLLGLCEKLSPAACPWRQAWQLDKHLRIANILVETVLCSGSYKITCKILSGKQDRNLIKRTILALYLYLSKLLSEDTHFPLACSSSSGKIGMASWVRAKLRCRFLCVLFVVVAHVFLAKPSCLSRVWAPF